MAEKKVTLTLAGTSFRQKEIGGLTKESPIFLHPEPSNEYDPYAVKIVDLNGNCIGYIPGHLSRTFSELISETGLIPSISIFEITEYKQYEGKILKGVTIEITYPNEIW